MKKGNLQSVKLISLYLVPGILIAAFYYLIAPIMIGLGLPSPFTLSLGIMIVLIPVQLGILLVKRNPKTDGSLLREILITQTSVNPLRFILYVIGLVVFAGLVYALLSSSLNVYLKDEIFTFIPGWARAVEIDASDSQLTITILSLLVFGNILGPLVEELYFRGYLLYRTPGAAIPRSLLNAFLFAVYHFWSPWDIVARTLAVAPYAYVTLKTDNVWIAITAHIAVNMLASFPILMMLF